MSSAPYLTSSFSPQKLINMNKIPALSSSNPEFLQIYQHSPIQRLSFNGEELLDPKIIALSRENEEISRKIAEKSQEALYWKAKYQEILENSPGFLRNFEDFAENEKKIALLIEENAYLKQNLVDGAQKPVFLERNAEFIEKIARLEEGINSVLSENDKLNAVLAQQLEELAISKRKLVENENKTLSFQQENARLLRILAEKDEEIFKLLEEKIYLKEKSLENCEKHREIEENRELREKIEKFQAIVESLRETQRKDQETHAKTLKSQAETLKVAHSREISEEKARFAEKIQRLEREIAEIQGKCEEISRESAEKTEKMREIVEKSQDFERKVELLLRENEKLNRICQENSENAEKFREKSAKMGEKLVEQELLKQELLEKVALLQEFQRNFEEKVKENQEFLRKIAVLSKENEQDIQENQRLAEKIADLSRENAEITTKLEVLMEKNRELRDFLEENDEKVKVLLNFNEKLNESLENCVFSLETHKTRAISLENQLKFEQNAFFEEKTAILKEKARLSEENAGFLLEISRLSEENRENCEKTRVLQRDLLILLQTNRKLIEKFNENQRNVAIYHEECRKVVDKVAIWYKSQRETREKDKENRENLEETQLLQEKVRVLKAENADIKAKLLRNQQENSISLIKTSSLHINQRESQAPALKNCENLENCGNCDNFEEFPQGNYEEINEYVEKLRRKVRNLKISSENSREIDAERHNFKEIQQVFSQIKTLKRDFAQKFAADSEEFAGIYQEINGKIRFLEEIKQKL